MPAKRPSGEMLQAVRTHAQRIREEFDRCLVLSPTGAACVLPKDHAEIGEMLRRHRDERGNRWD